MNFYLLIHVCSSLNKRSRAVQTKNIVYVVRQISLEYTIDCIFKRRETHNKLVLSQRSVRLQTLYVLENSQPSRRLDIWTVATVCRPSSAARKKDDKPTKQSCIFKNQARAICKQVVQNVQQ